ncbi:RNA-directed DNA polymerase from mobile element jockey-like [Brachionus plicatilis]|uniref:RNA-directed DNA polymerase from mobile element jockey-like n=1 Tax=Brachionus plicatilis TaxID=10195 RepID=A0A3M7RH04_BRAPC|nr:RNA-directed DNA polymerase from mobile element jockey-like [Brachionus plicatilis]
MISAETGSRLTLEEIKTEKDLGVYFSSDLKWRTQCQHSAAKANSILGQLRQAFHAWNPQSFISLYTAFIGPHLEYATSVWNPHRRPDIRIIENIQRRATKKVGRIRDRSYQDRLAILNLTTLESRRSRGDLISHYKIANGLLDVNWLASTKLMSSIACHGPANAIRGPKKRLFVQLSNCPARTDFLNNRVASTWNNLVSPIVNAPSLNSFKARLDIHLARTNTTTT